MTNLPSSLIDLPLEPLIHYDQPVVMLGGGDFDIALYQNIAAGQPVIAADSGGDHALRYGIKPDWVIGDMDSISTDARQAAGQSLQISDQFSTDFEKLLAAVEAPYVMAFGFLGQRMDHSLAAMHAIAKARQEQTIVLIDHYDAIIFCRYRFSAYLPQGVRLSIWPLRHQQFIKSQGLVWPVDGLSLEAGGVLGTSNQVLMHDHSQTSLQNQPSSSDEVKVSIEGGDGDGFFVLTDGHLAKRLLEN